MRPDMPLVSNSDQAPLEVWIEPWCDELTLPSRSTLGFSLLDPGDPGQPPIVEMNDEGTLVIWATSPGRLAFTIDGVAQDTGSRAIALPPAMFELPVKQSVQIMFGDFPEARSGGSRLKTPLRPSWCHRLTEALRR